MKKPPKKYALIYLGEVLFLIILLIYNIAFPQKAVIAKYLDGNRFVAAFLIIVVGFVILIFSQQILTLLFKKNLCNSLPNLDTPAKVISRTSEETSYGKGGRNVSTNYFIAFELPDGTRKNFEVKIDQYNTILEDETGTLTYRESGTYLFFGTFQRHPQ